MEYISQVGDIIFKDSDQPGAKVAKYFMTAPTVWHHIYRAITRKQQKCEYYHPLLVISNAAIEQQWKVQYKDLVDAVNGNRVIIFRNKHIAEFQKNSLVIHSVSDIGQKWGVVHVWGRFFTWLTGIPYFARYLKLPNEEVSAGRVARWYSESVGETFGHKTYQEATSNTMVRYMLAHPEQYEVVYKKD